MALELTNIYWECLTTNGTSIEETYQQTYEAFEHAQSWSTFITEHLIENGHVLAALTLLASSGMVAVIKWIISTVLIESVIFLLLMVVLVLILVLAVVLAILTIIWCVVSID